MSRPYISNALRQRIFAEARLRGGYCMAQQDVIGVLLHIEHIIPERAGGLSEPENLWLACSECNLHKGAQTHMVDPETSEQVSLFHPRLQHWHEHFCWSEDGTEIRGTTPTGRATVLALSLNQPVMVRARRRWVLVGWHPPKD
jgi:hypothetical protein